MAAFSMSYCIPVRLSRLAGIRGTALQCTFRHTGTRYARPRSSDVGSRAAPCAVRPQGPTRTRAIILHSCRHERCTVYTATFLRSRKTLYVVGKGERRRAVQWSCGAVRAAPHERPRSGRENARLCNDCIISCPHIRFPHPPQLDARPCTSRTRNERSSTRPRRRDCSSPRSPRGAP